MIEKIKRIKIIISNIIYFKKIKLLSTTKTIEKIINEKCSTVRIGDGEMLILLGHDVGFEKASEILALKLSDILNSKSNSIFICINPHMIYRNNLHLNTSSKKHYRNYFHNFSSFIRSHLQSERIYGNASFSWIFRDDKVRFNRYYLSFYQTLQKIWDSKRLLIVEGDSVKTGVGNDLLSNANKIYRIICPSNDSFSCLTKIKREIIKRIDWFDVALIILGPSATVLSFELGIEFVDKQFIDFGSINSDYQSYLSFFKATSSVHKKTEDDYISEIVATVCVDI